MKQFLKGLSMDSDPAGTPEGCMTYAKNGVIKAGQVQSEPGFTHVDDSTYPIIGKVDAGDETIIISTNGTNTEFGRFKDGVYSTITNDASWTFRLGLRPDYYVTGQASRNYNNELIIALTNRDLPPLYINCDAFTVPLDIADLYLQPVADRPVLQIAVDSGGNIQPGAYFALAALGKKDGTITNWLVLEGPVIVPGIVAQNASIKLSLSNIDSSYPLVNLAIVHKDLNGSLTAFGLEDIQAVSGTANANYNGSNFPIIYTLDEVLSIPLFYDKVQTIGQVKDQLYMGGPEINDPPILQRYACVVQIGWKSELGTPGDRTIPHNEVLAVYIQYIRKSGARTKAYIIPGFLPAGAEDTTDTEATAAGLTGEDAKNYRSNPVPRSFNASLATGQMCAWKNVNEVYPDNEYFDATSIGGQNYRNNHPVCHHRTPSHKWCKDNLYQAVGTYGKSTLDKLSMTVTNVIIPPGTDIVGYEIMYAKRTPGTSLVQGRSLITCNAYRDPLNGGARGSNMMSTGTNWNSQLDLNSPRKLLIDRKEVRLIPFDMLFNNIQPLGTMLQAQFKLTHTSPRVEAFKEDGAISGPTAPYVWLFDYINHTAVSVASAAGNQRVRKINSTNLVLNSTVFSVWNNIHLETAVMCRLNTEYTIVDQLLNANPAVDGIQTGSIPTSEETYAVDMIHMKQDLYQSFANQILVKLAGAAIGQDIISANGDSFISDYTYHSYGKLDAEDNDQGNTGRPERGIRVIRRFLCETVSNLKARYEKIGNPYSQYYPASPITTSNDGKENYFLLMLRTSDPNDFGYSNTFNATNDLLQNSIFALDTNPVTKFPFRIHRTGKLSRQNKYRSWRTILPLDYYEMPRTHGPVVRLQGFNDKLLINMLKAFYVTIGNLNLIVENMSVALGSGDIFRIEPEEILPDQPGLGGLQDELAAILTPMGYVWYDAEAAVPYVYNGKLVSMANLIGWFLRELPQLQYHNPFRGEGIHMGWDPYFKRLLMTWCKQLPAGLSEVKNGVTLNVGQNYLYNGLVVKYMGTTTGCATQAGCDAPVITKTTPNITTREFQDSYIVVLGFTVTAGAQVALSGNAEYYKEKTGTSGGLDSYVLYQRPAANMDYNSVVTITAINACGTTSTTHTVAITIAGTGGGASGVGRYWPEVRYAVLQGNVCGPSYGVWTDAVVDTLTTGVFVFMDRFLTTPVEDNYFLRDEQGYIWNLLPNGQIDTPVMNEGQQVIC